MPARRRDLQLRLAGDQIHGGGERTVCTLIGNLRRQINSDAQRHAEDVEQSQERMPPQMPKDVPAENAQILRDHLDW